MISDPSSGVYRSVATTLKGTDKPDWMACQDRAMVAEPVEGVGWAFVADGVGSARHAEQGAEALRQAFAAFVEVSPLATDEPIAEQRARVVRQAAE
ncbi:MAG: protein phosphatase 2C domain-containing protein, partial [Phycisphaeraceae bacterium]|nr:protein phosphatase 2C domain-containing protein [Phycisphaeraceae bacterium]